MCKRTGKTKKEGGESILAGVLAIASAGGARVHIDEILSLFFFFLFLKAGPTGTGTATYVFKVMNVMIDRPTGCAF